MVLAVRDFLSPLDSDILAVLPLCSNRTTCHIRDTASLIRTGYPHFVFFWVSKSTDDTRLRFRFNSGSTGLSAEEAPKNKCHRLVNMHSVRQDRILLGIKAIV